MKIQRCRITLITLLSAVFIPMLVLASGAQSNPRIALRDSRPLNALYGGPKNAASDLQQNRARGLSLTSGDFDEDGVPDLVVGYEAAAGGILALHRGNIDAIYSNSFAAQEWRKAGTFTDSPFLSPALVFELPVSAEFLGAGDFDADNHLDLVFASSSDASLYWMTGNGNLELSTPKRIPLPGNPTALVVGDINRLGVLKSVVIAVNGPDGPKVMVFEGADGALRNAQPEIFSLPTEAVSLALGNLDQDRFVDLAVAAANELIIIHGGDRKVEIAKRTIIPFSFQLSGLAIGNFSMEDKHQTEIAILSTDGRVQYLRRKKSGEVWEVENEISVQSNPSAIIKAKVSTYPTDDVLISGGETFVLSDTRETSRVSGETVAMIPMRLTPHALNSIVILEKNQSMPSILKTTPSATYTVTNTLDNGPGSLRDAIKKANKNPGLDEIHFQIGSGPQTILLNKKLPTIKDPVLIDGSTQPAIGTQNFTLNPPRIMINGSSILKGDGLKITGGSTVVRGFAIGNFPGSGIKIKSDNNFAESNFIGLDLTGTIAAGNLRGFLLSKAVENIIGGPAPLAGNLITANTEEAIKAKKSDSITVLSNFIGFDIFGNPVLNAAAAMIFEKVASLFLSDNSIASAGPAALFDKGSNLIFQNNQVTDFGTANSSNYSILSTRLTPGVVIANNIIIGTTQISTPDYSAIKDDFGSQLTIINNTIVGSEVGIVINNNPSPQLVSNIFKNTTIPISNGVPNPAILSNATPSFVTLALSGYLPNTGVGIEINRSETFDLSQDVRPIAQTTATTDATGNLSVTIPYTAQAVGFVTSLLTPQNSGTTEFGNVILISTTGNSPPQFQNVPGPQTFTENDFVSLPFNVLDPDGDTFTVIAVNTPEGVQLIQTAPNDFKLEGTLSFDSAGNYNIGLTATDINNNSAQVTIPMAVLGTNQPPNVTNPGTQINTVGDTVAFQIVATDPEDDNLSYSMSGQPPGISIDPDDGFVAGTLPSGSEGTYTVTVGVSDQGLNIVNVVFQWIVNPAGTTFVVTNTNDSGTGSLRQAILNANAAGSGIINFNIAGGGPKIISPLSLLPDVIVPIIIDGTSQPGFSGVPLIFLNGQNLALGNLLTLLGGNSTIKSIGFNNSPENGLVLSGSIGNYTVQDSYFGVGPTGTDSQSNAASGIRVLNSPNWQILNSVISANVFAGIEIKNVTDGSNTIIAGNNIGTTADGTAPLGNFVGVLVDSSPGVVIGGDTPAEGNVVGKNQDGIIVLLSNNVQIKNNFVGTDRNNTLNLGNVNFGFGVADGSDIVISTNVFANNGAGATVLGNSNGVKFDKNSFYNNIFFGIDLNNDGPTSNDALDADTGPNGLQNYPVITDATSNFATGFLNSKPNTTYEIQFFTSPTPHQSGFGEGKVFVGSKTVTTNSSGNVSFTHTFPMPLPGSHILSTLAIDPAGSNSEFGLGSPI